MQRMQRDKGGVRQMNIEVGGSGMREEGRGGMRGNNAKKELESGAQ